MSSIERRIKAIDVKTAKTLSSGQVITNLSNVVKELLENSMDAKANVITIRLKDMGKELIEVIDNGIGISEEDFNGLAKRHYTSKLSQFEDLPSITSFGFRGEALNSLCNLAEVVIETRHMSQDIGTLLKFDSDGNVVSKELKARPVGTTVVVKNLFHTIPVRRKEFQNNIKRDFDKMVRLVTGYCVGSVGLRITLTNQMPNKGKQTVLSSAGLSIKNNIICIFDTKQLESLLEIKPKYKSEEQSNDIKMFGFISKCDSGFGRSTADRQFLYVNQRPCEMKNLTKFINDIYRSFNRNQYPFVILNIEIDKTLVDFNLSPDKRQLLIANEDNLFDLIKETLTQMFDKQSNCRLDSMTNYTTKVTQFSQKRRQSVDDEEVISSGPLKISRCRSPCDSPFKHTDDRDLVVTPPLIPGLHIRQLNDSIDSDLSPNKRIEKPKSFTTALNAINIIQRPQPLEPISVRNQSNSCDERQTKPLSPIKEVPIHVRDVPMGSTNKRIFSANTVENSGNDSTGTIGSEKRKCLTEFSIIVESDDEEIGDKVENKNEETNEETNEDMNEDMNTINETNDENNDIIIDLNMDSIKEEFYKSVSTKESTNEYKFSAKINASQNERAEQELIHELEKSSFESMQIIGQFNKSFVVTKLGTDLFVVDPHAANERFNYETLLRDTKIEIQKLVHPMALELSAANEQVVIDNLITFKKYGFGITVDEKAPSGHRLYLSSLPMSKDWTAGREDIEEMVGRIIETPIHLQNDYKLNGFKKAIASRACRSAVMIGESLSKSQMKTIVSQMSELQNPWHCAHNRPTIRHLINLKEISLLSNN